MSTQDGTLTFQGIQQVPCSGGCGGFLWATEPTTCDACLTKEPPAPAKRGKK